MIQRTAALILSAIETPAEEAQPEAAPGIQQPSHTDAAVLAEVA